ncbi:MAG: PaaX family transcriptional regulator C-terminal domain-containing protein, partial [Pseudomonadota bacterium]
MTSSRLPETDAATLEPLAQSVAPRAKALIMTFWGDMLLPWGGRIWLGSLVRAMAPFGLDEQNVRASVNRLVQEGWLTSETVGRRRELSMPAPRLEELRAVQSRMYRRTPLDWDDLWRVLVVQPASPARREAMRRELRWQGYANLAPNTFIHPRQNWAVLSPRLAARGLEHEVVHAFEARSVLGTASPVHLWPLQTIAGGWASLLELLERMPCTPQTDPAAAFSMRLMLAHVLRLTVLKDPALPNGLLSADWPEVPARAALGRLYADLAGPANRYLQEIVERADGSPAGFVR